MNQAIERLASAITQGELKVNRSTLKLVIQDMMAEAAEREYLTIQTNYKYDRTQN